MTNEEAIAIIRREYLCVSRDCDIEKNCGRCDLMMPSKESLLEAYKMAMDALEQEPSGDLISRQEAIKAIDEKAKRIKNADTLNGLAGAVGILFDLPSVNQQESCEDAISRQAVNNLQKYRYNCGDTSITCISLKSVNDLPSVKPQPKMGHWVKTPKAVMGEGYMWYCDKCEHQVYQDSSRSYPSEKYCPNCGTRMVEEQESEVQDADSN